MLLAIKTNIYLPHKSHTGIEINQKFVPENKLDIVLKDHIFTVLKII